MGELSKAAKELNLPKQLLDKGEKAIKAVFGPSISEISETFADNFRLRRFKNQVKILSKAQQYLEKSGLEPRQIDLKVLVPLVQFCSLEENTDLQEKWSKLITNVVLIEGEILLKQNCIEIISKISNEEASLLDFLHELFMKKRQKRYERDQNREWLKSKKELKDYPLRWFSFSLKEITEGKKIERLDLELMISNLVALGVLKWEPEAEVHTAEKSDTDPEDTSIDIDIEVYDSETIKMTNLGYEFVQMCKIK